MATHLLPETDTIELHRTARYLASAVCEGANDLEEVIETLVSWESDRPGALQAAASPQLLTGTTDDLALALLCEAAATARAA
jgi:hypothetical protein